MNRIVSLGSASVLARHCRRARRGITIVELLIAMTVSLIMVYALIQTFANLVAQVSDGRASVEITGQLRGTTHRLQTDLRNVTVPVRPWASPDTGLGYFEYLDGPGWDFQYVYPATGQLRNYQATSLQDMTFGDIDDVLAMTIHSEDRPFVGQVQVLDPNTNQFVSTTTNSHYAEVVWWTVWNDADDDGDPRPGEITLYRRALLIRPDLGRLRVFSGAASQALSQSLLDFFNNNDISVRPEVSINGTNITVEFWANSLADLTKRENRFCHRPILAVDRQANSYAIFNATFPFPLAKGNPHPYANLNAANPTLEFVPSLTTVRQDLDQLGEDVIQADVLAFDVRGYDAEAPILSAAGDALTPSDPGFPAAVGAGAPQVGKGAFVDLNFTAKFGTFGTTPLSRPPSLPLLAGTYCTWSYHYEQDGIDQNANNAVDEGTNGLDDNGLAGVDDPSERETSPPYPVALRGLKVSIRVIEPDSRQVKQMSVVQDFTPE